MFSTHQETLNVDMVRQNNALKLHEVQQKIIEDHVNVEGINSVSLSTIVLKSNRMRMKQLYCIFLLSTIKIISTALTSDHCVFLFSVLSVMTVQWCFPFSFTRGLI